MFTLRRYITFHNQSKLYKKVNNLIENDMKIIFNEIFKNFTKFQLLICCSMGVYGCIYTPLGTVYIYI